MKSGWVVGMVLLSAGLMAGCATEVKRIAADDVVDLSGRWNDTDSKLVSEEMVKQALARPWLANFTKSHGGTTPKVIVGTVDNKTDEHIALDTFVKDIERELINSGMIQFVAAKTEREEIREEREDQQTWSSEDTRKQLYDESGADYIMQGTISKITDARGSQATFYYQVDMELVDMQKSVKVWSETKQIKKYLKRPGARF
jgi:penicillin-binding protein activator